jgi:acyl-CoA dehydrogenase
MLTPPSARAAELRQRISAFMEEHILPAEEIYRRQHHEMADHWGPVPIMEELKAKAKTQGLWNLFLPKEEFPDSLTNVEYATLCEIMGRSPIGSEPFNCSAPDTGNMETIARYGTKEQKERWLKPLMEGEIRSCFAMTEPAVASSDATNIQGRIVRDGDHYVLNARKWWTSGANDPRCKVLIFMGKTDPDHPDRHKQQSMIVVPMDTPGVKVLRHLPVFGYDDAPHGHAEMSFTDVRVPAANLLFGEGRGFEIAQGRLGPGRIHHCMRLIGVAERALEKMCKRTLSRVAFGRPIAEQTVTLARIADARILIDQTRLLVLDAADKMDKAGNKAAAKEIAMIKVAAPTMACQVLDWAIQAHGGGGVSNDFGLAYAYAHARTLRLADGPDEVHRNQIGKLELARYRG